MDSNQKVLNKFEIQKEILDLQNAYTVIRAMLTRLELVVPDDSKLGLTSRQYVADLMKLGYSINTHSSLEYKHSILNGFKRSNSILTLIQMKKNQLNEEIEERYISFEELQATISAELKFLIPVDITVASYCEYKKILKRKVKNFSG